MMQISCHNIKRRADQRSALLCVGIWYQNFYFISSCRRLLEPKSKVGGRRAGEVVKVDKKKKKEMWWTKPGKKSPLVFQYLRCNIYMHLFLLLRYLFCRFITQQEWQWVVHNGVIKCYIWNSPSLYSFSGEFLCCDCVSVSSCIPHKPLKIV